MSKKIIGSYIFYLAILAFSWVLVGQIIQVNLTVDKLVKVSGTIEKTLEVAEAKFKSNRYSYELRIFLKDTAEYFRFMDIYKYDRFREKIQPGDSADIYIRPKWLVPLGMGYRNDIFQMSVGHETIFDLSQTKPNNTGIIIITMIAIPIFYFLGRYVKKR